MTVYNNTDFRRSSDQGTPPSSPSNADERQSENRSTSPPNESIAETTYLKIDDQASEGLDKLKSEVTARKISVWVGSYRRYLRKASDKISIKEARLINQNSGRSIFEIKINHLFEFKITDSARAILQSLQKRNFTSVSKSLGLPEFYLKIIKDRDLLTIPKENAEKINKFFKKDIFCMQQIFDRACNESIEEVRSEQAIDNPAEFTLIKSGESVRKKLNSLDPSIRTKIKKLMGMMVFQRDASTSIGKAVVVNKISGLNIYSFSVQNLHAVPYSNVTRDKLNKLLNQKNKLFIDIAKDSGIPVKTLKKVRIEKQKRIQYDIAVKINAYLGERLFDFEKILNEAVTEADHLYNTSRQTKEEAPVSQKRKRKDNENSQPPAKKQKIREFSTEEKEKTDPIEPSPTASPVQRSPKPASVEEEQLSLNEEQEWTTSSDEAIQAIPEKRLGHEWVATPPSPSFDLFPPGWASTYSSSDPLSEDLYPPANPESTLPRDPEMDFFFSSDL